MKQPDVSVAIIDEDCLLFANEHLNPYWLLQANPQKLIPHVGGLPKGSPSFFCLSFRNLASRAINND